MGNGDASFIGWFSSKIKSRDKFGRNIDLFYKKDGTYKTLLGGLASILLYIAVMVMGYYMIRDILQLNKIYISQNTAIVDFSKAEASTYNITKKQLTFGIRIENNLYNNSYIPPEYGSLSLAYYDITNDGSDLPIVKYQSIKLVP